MKLSGGSVLSMVSGATLLGCTGFQAQGGHRKLYFSCRGNKVVR